MGTTLSAEAVEARRSYYRQYRAMNREKINSRNRKWKEEHPEAVQESNRRYWEKVGSIRASWADYGIDDARRKELQEIVKSGQYADLVLSSAVMADKKAAEHILLSVKKDISYDYLEFNEKLGRCTLGRTDFYGARRLFFHNLDIALKDNQKAEKG